MSLVSYEDPSPNGLAELLGGLISSNLEREPSRMRLLRSAVVRISAVDAEVGATISISSISVVISSHLREGADLDVSASSMGLLVLAAVPLRFGMPDPAKKAGRAVIWALLRRKIRVRGLIRHPVKLARLNELLSVN